MRRRLASVFTALVGACAATAPAGAGELSAASQPACTCTSDDARGLGTGVLWQGTEPLGLADIAALTAPVLWFSADEPLLDPAFPPVPSAHPCDEPASGPVVYYQVTRIAYRGEQPVTRPEEDDPAFFDKVDSLILKFFFYYPEDYGAGGHVHDLESTELEIFLENDGPCRRLRVARVEALAHGNRWYSNILVVQPDTKFPVTVFVEEGKHASAPDRNADGHYMRGYDVTERINDAWGVRDSLGQGVLLTAGYNAEMTKPRTDEFRLLPPDDPRLCVPARRSSTAGRASLGRYSLRPANRVPTCNTPVNGRFLTDMMGYHGFGETELPTQFPADSLKSTLSRVGGPDQWLSLSLRGTGSRIGAAVVVKGLDLREGWLVPRFTVDDVKASGELMFTPSASRWADVYFSAGAQRQFKTVTETRTVDTEEGRQDLTVILPPDWAMAIEAGIRFRAEIPRKMRPFVLGYNFGGVRLGLRGVGFPTIERWQLIWEIGAGAW